MAERTVKTKWQMHESSQRGLCRAAFVLLGFAPLLLVIAFSIAQFVPAYQEYRAHYWSTWLSTRLGVDVQVAAVELLAPEHYVLHGLRLSHPESRASLGRIRSVQVKLKASESKWSIELDQPEFETRQLSATWRMIHDWFVCRPQVTQPKIEISCPRLSIREMDSEQILEKIFVVIYPRADQTIVDSKFHMAGAEPNANPSHLIIGRRHSDRHLSTNFQLVSGSTGLPCNLISPVLPVAQRLGDRAIFLGTLSLYQTNSGWLFNLKDSWLVNVDYSKINPGIVSHVTNDNFVRLDNLTVTDHGLHKAKGGIKVVHGRIDGDLLNASQQTLGVNLTRPVKTAGVAQSFEQFGASFEIETKQGIFKLCGGLQNTLPDSLGVSRPLAPGTLVADASGEIAVRSNYDELLPLQSLVTTLEYHQGVTTASATSSDNPANWFTSNSNWWLPAEESR